MIITIDGPAGSGKSSTAKAVAEKLGWSYLDSGSLYRAVTWLFVHKYASDIDSLIQNLNNHSLKLVVEGDLVLTVLDEKALGNEIRDQHITSHVSKIAELAEVRKFVNDCMYRATSDTNFVGDGRDLGTAVFPNALRKYYMVADIEVRANRRYKEMRNKGLSADINDIKANIAERDKIDSNRAIAPLTKPENAIEIDTSTLSFQEQVDYICNDVKSVL